MGEAGYFGDLFVSCPVGAEGDGGGSEGVETDNIVGTFDDDQADLSE